MHGTNSKVSSSTYSTFSSLRLFPVLIYSNPCQSIPLAAHAHFAGDRDGNPNRHTDRSAFHHADRVIYSDACSDAHSNASPTGAHF